MPNPAERLAGKVGEFVNGRDHERRGATYLGLGFAMIILTPIVYAIPREAQETVSKIMINAPLALLAEGFRQLEMAKRSRQQVIAS